MVSYWNFSDSKSPQVSRTRLSILTEFNNAVVWIVSICHLISKSSSLGTYSLVSVPSTTITIGITVIFMFHSFSNSLAKSRYSSFFSFSFNLTLWSAGTVQFTIWLVLFFCWLSLGLVVWPRLGDPSVSRNTREVCALSIYHLFVWFTSFFFFYSNISLNFLSSSVLFWIFQPILIIQQSG